MLEGRRVLAAVAVNTFADLVDGNVSSISTLIANPGADGKISLREAVAAAASSGDVINFDASVDGGTITLNRAFLGEISFGKSLTIDASGLPNGITIDADDPTPGTTGTGIRIFNIVDSTSGTNPPSVELVGLTLTGGDASGNGGAISSQGSLTIRNSALVDNEATSRGGAVYVEMQGGGAAPRSMLIIEDSLIDGNYASGAGGGVAVLAGNFGANADIIMLDGVEFSDNKTPSSNGGGLYAELYGSSSYGPQLTLSDSTLALNEASAGGGVYATLNGNAELSVIDSLLEENDAVNYGAGLYLQAYTGASLHLEGATLDGNEAGQQGGGVYASLYDCDSPPLSDSGGGINYAARTGA